MKFKPPIFLCTECETFEVDPSEDLCKYCKEGDWCNICDNPIKRKNSGVFNYKTELRAHTKCARKEGLLE